MRDARRRARAFASAAAGLGLALLLVPAAARAETWKGLDLKARMARAPWHFGPFLIQPTLVLSNAGVDSNVYYSPTEPVKDFTATAGPAATIYVPIVRPLVLSVYGSPQYVWYSKTERERTWNYYFRGSAQLSLKSVFFSLDGVYSDARERWNTEIDIRPRRQEAGYGGSALVKVAWKTSFEVAYRTSRYDYQSVEVEGGVNVRERLNRDESYATVSAYYQVSSLSRFALNFEYGRYDFQAVEQAAISDSQSRAAYAGFEFSPLGSRLRGRVRVGYKNFNVRNPAFPDYRGLVGDTQFLVRLNKPLALRASYIRDVRFSLWYDNPFYVESRPAAGASLYLFRYMRLDYDYSFGHNRYSLAGGGGPDVKRLDNFSIHSAGLYVRIARSTALGFIVSFWQRESNIVAENDKRTFFGLNLTYDF